MHLWQMDISRSGRLRKHALDSNPSRPETDVPIPDRAMVKFKAGKEMKGAVLNLTPMSAKKTP
jgi:hypothetical protein